MHLDAYLLNLARRGRFSLLIAVALGFLAGALAIPQAEVLTKVISRIFLGRGSLAQVFRSLEILLGALILRVIFGWLGDLAAHRAARQVKGWLRRRFLSHLGTAASVYTGGEQTGELTNTYIEGVEALDPYISQYLPGLAAACLTPMIILIYVFRIDLLSGFVFLFTAPLIPLFMVLIGSLAQELTRKQWRTLSRLSAYFLDVIQGLTTLKTLGRSQEQVSKVAQASESYRQATMNVLKVTFLSALTLEMASTLSTALVAVEIGLRLLYARMTFEQAFVILLLAPEYYLPLRTLGARFHAGMSGVEAGRRILQALGKIEPENAGASQSAGPALSIGTESIPSRHLFEQIRFEGVEVRYEEGRPALKGISFHLCRGERVGLAGPSGSGKSTIAALLLRFVEPEKGAITVDGIPLEEFPAEEWRKRVTWVPQRPYLFDDTIAANIRLGRPDADQDAVEEAARLAEADDFIRGLPQGYETHIGERGVRLSGGEAQRIALARVFLMDSDLVILDEATAHLDAQAEAALQRVIDRLLANRTSLVIAHRMKTIRSSDRIILLEKGKISQIGTHTDLVRQSGLYQKLVLTPEPENMEMAVLAPDFKPADRAEVSTAVELTPAPVRSKVRNIGRTAVFFRLLRLASKVWKWIGLSVLAGSATILSGVGLMATSAYIICAAALHPSIAILQVPIVGVRFFGITRGLFRYLERYSTHNTTFKLLAKLRVWFYRSLEPLAPARLMRFRSGDLLTRILNDIQSLDNFYVRALAPPLAALVGLFFIFLFVSSFHLKIALELLIFWGAAGLAVPIAALRLGRRAGAGIVNNRAVLSARMVEFIQGLPELQVFNQVKRFGRRVISDGETLEASQQEMGIISSSQSAVSNLLGYLGMWAVLTTAIPMVSAGQIQPVFLAVVALTALTSFEAVSPLPAAAQQMESNLQSAQRLSEVVDAEPEVVDSFDLLPVPSAFDLRVEDLYFCYPGDRPVIRGLFFDLPAGKRMSIVGPSGAGKSTLVNLLLRYWDYEEGHILLNGEDLHCFAQDEVRAQISLVPQQVYLFNMSVRDNILIAHPQASEEDMFKAARLAGIHDFILSLPEGYETWVGELGARLSAGERQRIALARALIRPARLFILDEGTVNLDALNERHALESIFKATAGRSLLMITHRLAGMEAMDEILVMDQGVAVARGNHAELLAAGGLYAAMWKAQRLNDAP